MPRSSTDNGGQYENKYLILTSTRNIRLVQTAFMGEGTSVVYPEPARINEEIATREIA